MAWRSRSNIFGRSSGNQSLGFVLIAETTKNVFCSSNSSGAYVVDHHGVVFLKNKYLPKRDFRGRLVFRGEAMERPLGRDW